jgi:hypothetical protein
MFYEYTIKDNKVYYRCNPQKEFVRKEGAVADVANAFLALSAFDKKSFMEILRSSGTIKE